MLHEDNHYNKGEDLDHCAECNKQFTEDEPVSVVNYPNGPYRIVCKKCVQETCVPVEKSDWQHGEIHYEPIPLDLMPNDKLWRYMDLSKFISMLKDRALFFSSPTVFDDIYEGAHGELRNKKAWDDFYMSFARATRVTAPDNCWHKVDKAELDSNATALVNSLSIKHKFVYVNCWHHNEYESEAMWKIYAKDFSNAIAIQTTFSDLLQQIGNKATIKKVRYIDYSRQFVGPNSEYWCKRKSFEHENEVRAILYNLESDKSGISVKVDVDALIHNIYISPYSPAWLKPLIADLVKKYRFQINIASSTMLEAPF